MSKLIDSAFEVCPVCDEYVLLDQTQGQCAREHNCRNVKCPLQRYFTGTEMHDPDGDAAEKAPAQEDQTGSR